MTQPDELLPAGAANFASLAAWAAKTQSDWETEIYDSHETRWADAESGFLAILQQIPIIGDIIEVLTGIEDADTTDLGTWVNNLLDSIQAIIDAIVQALFGWIGSGWTNSDALAALSQQNSNLVSNSVAIQSLWNTVLALGGVTDNFTRSETDLGEDWSEYYGSGVGSWDTNGTKAAWSAVWPYGDRDSVCVHTEPSLSDYQTTSIVVGSACSSAWDTYYGAIDVIGRCDDANPPQNYIRYRVRADNTWSLVSYVGGVPHTIDSGAVANPGPGAILTLVCGDESTATPRYFTVKLNDTVLNDVYTDASSAYGADYRSRGFGGAQNGTAAAVAIPASVDSWSSYDTPSGS